MIYEFRTYTLSVGSVAEFEDKFATALPHREKYSKLTACWHTEIGPLNQVIHVWAYEDIKHRAEVRAEANQDPNWPPSDTHMVQRMETEIVTPAPFQGTIEPGKYGKIYEMRYYDTKPGTMPKVMDQWIEKLPKRQKHSKLFFCGYTEMGLLNKLIHIWPYEDMNERARIRSAAVAAGDWPPKSRDSMVAMHNKIMVPSSFSPVQ